MAAQVVFETLRIDLACLPQRPSDSFLDKVVSVGTEGLRDLIRSVQGHTFPNERDKSNDRSTPHPQISILRPNAKTAGESRILDQKRTDEQTANGIGCRPIRRVVS